MSVTVVVLTEELLLVVLEVVGVDPLGTCTFGVDTPLAGLESAVCWMSLPCSLIRAVASSPNFRRRAGTIFFRTRSLTGCFDVASE